MKIQIKITKDILKRSMMCGVKNTNENTANCAIALAIRDIAPDARVLLNSISWDGTFCTPLDKEISDFIWMFDGLRRTPIKRLEIPEFSFEVYFPDQLIEKIGIEQITEILSKSETISMA